MTVSDLTATVAAYDALLKRALEVAESAPLWTYVDEPKFARVEITGDTCRLRWPHDTMDYDSSVIEAEFSKPFPLTLLLMDDAERKEWKQAQRAAYDREQKMKAEQAAKQAEINREQQERQTLAALKRKYGE